MRNNAASIIGNGVILLLWQLRCHCNPDHDKFSSLSNTTVVAIFPNVCLWQRIVYAQTWQVYIDPENQLRHFRMPVRGPMLLHRMALVSFRLFCKNLGNLQEFFGQMVYRPPWPKIARTPMRYTEQLWLFTICRKKKKNKQQGHQKFPGSWFFSIKEVIYILNNRKI